MERLRIVFRVFDPILGIFLYSLFALKVQLILVTLDGDTPRFVTFPVLILQPVC